MRSTGNTAGGVVGTVSPTAGQAVVQATNAAAAAVDAVAGSPPSGAGG